jgi:hypothetical protein
LTVTANGILTNQIMLEVLLLIRVVVITWLFYDIGLWIPEVPHLGLYRAPKVFASENQEPFAIATLPVVYR